jgi:hypothetical protein
MKRCDIETVNRRPRSAIEQARQIATATRWHRIAERMKPEWMKPEWMKPEWYAWPESNVEGVS